MKTIKQEVAYIKKRNGVLNTFMSLAQEKDFLKVESDLFEGLFDFKETNKRFKINRLIKVENRKGELFVVRPDITSNIIKQVIPRITPEDELKLYYLDNIYQFDTNGNMNETRQFGVEMIGGSSNQKEEDLLSFLDQLLTEFSINYYIEIGNHLFIDTLINQITDKERLRVELKEALMNKNTSSLDQLIDTETPYTQLLYLILNPLCEIDTLKSFIVTNNLNGVLLEELKRTIDIAKQVSKENITIDMSLVTPYDYYNGMIFKGYMNHYRRDVFRGGRYDTLTKEYGTLTSALGFSLDMNVFINEVIGNE